MKLFPSLTLGMVELNVNNLTKMRDFYHQTMGLEIVKEHIETVILGKNKTPLITLYHTKDLTHAPAGHAGLYHFAIVFSSRGDLARTIFHILKHNQEYFSGSADHLVSEAFYFTDPEGNGIELYFDRDRSEWKWENNQIKMATLYVDPEEYLRSYIGLEEAGSQVQMGHFHLKVGDIEKARTFYVDILGFDVTAVLPRALFISVGGYHHHIGLNSWESLHSPKRDKSIGLEILEFIVPAKEDLEFLKQRLSDHHIEFSQTENSITFADPWGNRMRFKIR